jgi:uroporphyrinogen decarboxylase
MTPKARIVTALWHRESDFCPYDLGFDVRTRERLVEFTGDPEFDREVIQHFAGVGIGYPETGERIDQNHYTDAFGVIWEQSIPGELGVVNDPVLKEPSLRGYAFPPARRPGLFDGFGERVAEAAATERYVTWGIGFSLYERAWSLRGIEGFLLDLVEHPRFAHELLDRICEFNLALIEQACGYPIDNVRFGDDWGSQRGLIMGPALWREFIKPRFARMVGAARAAGKTAMLHTDGDVSAILPDLIEVGLTVLNPVQPDVMDIYAIKRKYGRDLCFHGGVSVQHFLPDSTEAEVRAEVRRLIREVGAGGGFIIAPTHSLGSDIPDANLVALVEEFTRQTEIRDSKSESGRKDRE